MERVPRGQNAEEIQEALEKVHIANTLTQCLNIMAQLGVDKLKHYLL